MVRESSGAQWSSVMRRDGRENGRMPPEFLWYYFTVGSVRASTQQASVRGGEEGNPARVGLASRFSGRGCLRNCISANEGPAVPPLHSGQKFRLSQIFFWCRRTMRETVGLDGRRGDEQPHNYRCFFIRWMGLWIIPNIHIWYVNRWWESWWSRIAPSRILKTQ